MARLESRYITLSTNRDFEYSYELPVEDSSVLVVIVGKRWSLGGQQVVPLMNEDFGPLYRYTFSAQHREAEIQH